MRRTRSRSLAEAAPRSRVLFLTVELCTFTFRRNGTSLASIACGANTAVGGAVRIGSDYSGAAVTNGHILFLAVYNAALLLTIALTGAAGHLLTVRLTGSHVAGLTAGLLCGFNDYRFFWSLGHVQTLSIHWWIFAVWGLDVFVERVQHLSSREGLFGGYLAHTDCPFAWLRK